jgi:hypothetical protein
MEKLDGRAVVLSLSGDDLDPAIIGATLGPTASFACRKGELSTYPSGEQYVERTGSWKLGCDDPEDDLDAQVRNVLSRVTSDPSAWKELTNRFRCELMCAVFLGDWREETRLQPETLSMISDRGLTLVFDIYGPVPR